jgi:hypothetical protein
MNYAIDTSAGTEIVTHTVFAKVQELRTELTALKHDHKHLIDRCTDLTNKLEFRQHLKQCSDEVKTWPKWKRDCL